MTADTLATPLGVCEVTAAQPGDVCRVLELRDQATRWLTTNGIRQWQPDDLPRDRLETARQKGQLWVLRHQRHVIGSVTITWHDPLIWPDVTDLAGYIHTLMIDRRHASHRVGRALLGWAERHIDNHARPLARLDCVRTNHRLRHYYEDLGYQLVGFKDFPHIDWALETALYQKSLSP